MPSKNIFKHPIRFIKTLIKAVSQGFALFKDNFMSHLQKGFQEWLFGSLAKGGIKLPDEFDGKGLFTLALQIFGITEDNIFKRIEKKIGKAKQTKSRSLGMPSKQP